MILAVGLSFCSLKAQKGLWVGAEVITDHKGNTGMNYFTGYFSKKDQILYVAPYLQAGYMPKMTFGDSSYKFLSIEPGLSAVLQFDIFKVKLGVATVQYTPLHFDALFSDSRRFLIPSLSVGTGQSLLGICDINVYYGHTVNFGPPNGISFKLGDPYTKLD